MKTFFEALMIADSEKVHTQTIAWILSLDKKVFSNAEKTRFINRLFGLRIQQISNIYVETEVNRIDLFFETDKDQFIIENKLKSSEHKGQTSLYSVPEKLKTDKKEVNPAFLSLTKDKAKNSEWDNISYENLLTSLQQVKFNEESKEFAFVSEYIQTLENLTTAFSKFIETPYQFPNVFTDGNKKKIDKTPYENPLQDYIRTNQLETIFQKAFLNLIANRLEVEYYEISETRGTALIQTTVGLFPYNGKIYRLGLQIQGQALKINIANEKYGNSRSDEIDSIIENSFKDTFMGQSDYHKLNRAKTKAYLSVSKRIPENIYDTEIEETVEVLNNEIDYIKTKKISFLNLLP